MIEMHFSLTEAEYLEAQALFLKQKRGILRWIRYSLIAILLASACVVLAAALLSHEGSVRAVLWQFLPFYVLIGFLCATPLIQKFSFKKRFLKEKANLTNARVRLDDDGYHVDIPGVGSGIAAWEPMSIWLEGKSVVMIRSGLLMRIFPKSAVSELQMQSVRELLTRKIGPVGISRTEK